MTTFGMNGPAENGRRRRNGLFGPEAADAASVFGKFGAVKPLNAARTIALLLLIGAPVGAVQSAAGAEPVVTEQCQQENRAPEARLENKAERESDAKTRPESGDVIENFPDGEKEVGHKIFSWFGWALAGVFAGFLFANFLLKL